LGHRFWCCVEGGIGTTNCFCAKRNIRFLEIRFIESLDFWPNAEMFCIDKKLLQAGRYKIRIYDRDVLLEEQEIIVDTQNN
jgi:hypothetical protein